MSYIDTYWMDCEAPAVYDSRPCLDFEFGKVRSVAFIRKRYLATLLANAEVSSVWLSGMAAGSVIVLPFVSGSFDPGEPAALKGYGRRITTRGPRDQVLTFSDPAYMLNRPFYNKLQARMDYVMAFRSATVLHIADLPADLFAKNVIEEDLQSTVAWEVKATWRSTDLPKMFDATLISSLFYSTYSLGVSAFFASCSATCSYANLVARFEIGAIGSPMSDADVVYSNGLLAGRKALVLVDGMALPVDDGSGDIDWSTSIVRHVEKIDASDTITFVGGVGNNSIIEIYAI